MGYKCVVAPNQLPLKMVRTEIRSWCNPTITSRFSPFTSDTLWQSLPSQSKPVQVLVLEAWVRPFFSFPACVSLIIHRHPSAEDGASGFTEGCCSRVSPSPPFRLHSQQFSFGDKSRHRWKFERHLFEHKQSVDTSLQACARHAWWI